METSLIRSFLQLNPLEAQLTVELSSVFMHCPSSLAITGLIPRTKLSIIIESNRGPSRCDIFDGPKSPKRVFIHIFGELEAK